MKFNKLAKELNLSVNELADKVTSILPNVNGGTDVSEEQKAQIESLLRAPDSDEVSLAFLLGDGTDPVLSVFIERIEQEQRLETPEQIVDQMVTRYIENPEDLPDDPEYREAVVTYVDLVKKRQLRRQQQSSRLRSLLSRSGSASLTAEPLALESFYGSGQHDAASTAQLDGNGHSPQLTAASS